MRILKMKLENFQGVKHFELHPEGRNCAVFGDNGTGKSTLYNAFTWLMYGKPSTSEKNYTPKTTGSHNLHHSIEMTVQLDDGAETVLKKDFHEVYKTVKGSAQAVLSGHTTDYTVDGVPVNETQFKKMLIGIYRNEDLAKMLTMFDYFLDGMKVADRRKILLQVCGDVDMRDVITATPELAMLPEVLAKPGNTKSMYSVEEYQAIATKEKGLTDKELKDIPNRIDEAERAKPDTGSETEEEIKKTIAVLTAAKMDLEAQRAAGENTADATIRQEIAMLEAQRASKEAEHVRAEALKNKGTFERLSNLRYARSDAEMAIMHLEQDKREHENEITRLNRRRQMLLEEWQAENDKQWSGSEICPTCKRPLPVEEVEQAKEEFNIAKARRLEEINQRGMRECSTEMIKVEQAEIEKLDAKIAEKRDSLKETEENIKAAENAVLEETDYKSTAEYAEITGKIEALREKLKDIRAAAAEADNVLSAKLRRLDESINEENQKNAAFALVKKQNERIAELETRETELAEKYERIQYGLHLCELYTRTKARMLDEKINKKFKTLRFRLFIEQQNGGIADDCEALIPCEGGRMVPFKSANNASRINAGLEVIDTLASHYGVSLPVFVDNAESVTKLQHTDTQVIRLVVSEADKTLRAEMEE